MTARPRIGLLFAAIQLTIALPLHAISPGDPADANKRLGDEIVIGGQFFHTGGASVVLWTDPDGRGLSDFARRPVTRPASEPTTIASTTEATSTDASAPTTLPFRTIRGPDVPLADLQTSVDQFVLHFDACGLSQECFRVLKRRRLSVQFMLDLDGTIYQAMDAGAAAQHATIANSRSVGVEIANIGGWPTPGPLPQLVQNWYRRENGQTRLVIPAAMGDGGIRTKNFVGHPARPDPVEGFVQGKLERQYDFTPQQYRALARLTATLCTVLPEIRPDFPRQRQSLGPPHTEPATQPTEGDPTTQPTALAEYGQPGMLIPHVLAPEQFKAYRGVLGHYHVQYEKPDPGPAMMWVPLMNEVRRLMTPAALKRSAGLAKEEAASSGTTRPAG